MVFTRVTQIMPFNEQDFLRTREAPITLKSSILPSVSQSVSQQTFVLHLWCSPQTVRDAWRQSQEQKNVSETVAQSLFFFNWTKMEQPANNNNSFRARSCTLTFGPPLKVGPENKCTWPRTRITALWRVSYPFVFQFSPLWNWGDGSTVFCRCNAHFFFFAQLCEGTIRMPVTCG